MSAKKVWKDKGFVSLLQIIFSKISVLLSHISHVNKSQHWKGLQSETLWDSNALFIYGYMAASSLNTITRQIRMLKKYCHRYCLQCPEPTSEQGKRRLCAPGNSSLEA